MRAHNSDVSFEDCLTSEQILDVCSAVSGEELYQTQSIQRTTDLPAEAAGVEEDRSWYDELLCMVDEDQAQQFLKTLEA